VANVDYFLRIDGIHGGSADTKHKDEIDIQSFSWGEQAALPSGGGGGAGKVTFQDFHFAARTNKASPKLMVACASGQHFKSARLTGRASQKESVDFLTVSFTDVLIASYDVGASSNEEPIDQFSSNFATISMQYKEQRADGTFETVDGGWDVKSNKQI